MIREHDDEGAYAKRQLIAQLRTAVYRLTGREYRIRYDLLAADDLRELQRLVRDIEYDKQAAKNQRLRNPWRRP